MTVGKLILSILIALLFVIEIVYIVNNGNPFYNDPEQLSTIMAVLNFICLSVLTSIGLLYGIVGHWNTKL